MAINPLVQAMMAAPRGRMTIGSGLNQAGIMLANAMMAKNARKKEQTALLGMLPPEAQAPPIAATQPQMHGAGMDLLSALTGQAPATAGVGPQIAAQTGMVKEAAGQANKQRAGIEHLINSGDPQLIGIAKQVLAKKYAPKPTGAQRYMNLGDQQVLDMTTMDAYDFSKDEPERLEKLSPGQALVGPDGEVVYTHPTDEKRRAWVQEVGAGNGMKQKAIIFEDGEKVPVGEKYSATQKIITSDAPPLTGDKVFTRQMVTAIGADQEAVRRSQTILTDFKPEYQTVWGKAAGQGLEWLDKVLPLADGKAKDYLQGLSRFQRKTNENMNLYIKMITGAQMSEAEAGRLSLAIANLTDSPAQFEAKLKDSIPVLERAQKKKQQELEYYAGVKGMDYDKALEYAEAAAAKEMRLGMTDIGLDWSEKAKEAEETGVFAPPGFKKGEDGVWRVE